MRRFPRNALTRADALAGPGHRFQHYRRDALGRKSEDARYAQDAVGTVTVTAGGNAHACNESNIVAGGKILTLTLVGPDRFNSANINDFINAFPATDGLRAALVAANFAFTNGHKICTLTLPAIAAYDISVNASYDVTLPATAFDVRATSLVVTAAIVVTAGA